MLVFLAGSPSREPLAQFFGQSNLKRIKIDDKNITSRRYHYLLGPKRPLQITDYLYSAVRP